MTTTTLTSAGMLRSELHKTWSVPSLRWLLLLGVPATALTVLACAEYSPGVAVATGAMVGGAVVALLAGLSIAGEYATGSVRTTMTVAPRRGALMIAKSTTVVLLGLLVGWLGSLVGAAAIGVLGVAVLPVLASGPVVAVTALFALFLGTLIRRVAPTAIATLFGVFLVSGLIGGLPLGDGAVADWLLSDSTVALVAGTPDWGRPLLVVVVWIVVAGAASVTRVRRADA